MNATKLTIDMNQGRDEHDRRFGYITDGEGGYFFTWMTTLKATLATIDPDEVDPPDFSEECAHESLSNAIAHCFDS